MKVLNAFVLMSLISTHAVAAPQESQTVCTDKENPGLKLTIQWGETFDGVSNFPPYMIHQQQVGTVTLSQTDQPDIKQKILFQHSGLTTRCANESFSTGILTDQIGFAVAQIQFKQFFFNSCGFDHDNQTLTFHPTFPDAEVHDLTCQTLK